ncbi:DUF6766 family protein [Flavobacterium johnsoniae]|uniref:Uncharacterized protein n=1 Tax=Flavobacterium johnsoniae TaxID=986 RepID=A0A1M5QWV4_FLAJO|nr:DUF6766 family protein [Flavobacterium johnsoniae]SHH18401.1 hypothetical protein SAMN05444388_107194 [Flavobacterium johnsoniae]
MKTLIRNNLSICFIVLFLGAIAGQVVFGFEEHNKELLEANAPAITILSYLGSGHFLQQKGSSESKDFDKEEEVDRQPSAKRKDAPWPVKKGGWILAIYTRFI